MAPRQTKHVPTVRRRIKRRTGARPASSTFMNMMLAPRERVVVIFRLSGWTIALLRSLVASVAEVFRVRGGMPA
jgi:hypothetical protein